MPLLPWFLGLVACAPVQDAEPEPLPLLDHAALTSELARLSSRANVSLHRVAVSRGGRAVEALELAAPDLPDDAPALLLVANLSGPRVFASSLALDHARRLAEGGDEARALLATTRVYIVPRANPDAAEARFATPRHDHGASGHGIDDDRDGRQGEDPPLDLDGDGFVTTLRVEDPEGTWMPDPHDPRVLIEADRSKGQRGRYRVYTEGRDTDGDERVAEDAALDARVDRNFPAGWEHHVGAAGLFPTDEPEVLGLIEFVLARPAIALVVCYDRLDNLVKAPKTVKDDARPVKRVPPTGILASDGALLKELGSRYADATGSKAEGEGSWDGSFSRWCYEHRGLLTLDAALWNLPSEAPAPPKGEDAEEEEGAEEGDAENASTDEEPAPKPKGKPSADAKHLTWIDATGEDWRFRPWTAYEHPELGPCEIGGFAPHARVEPPASETGALAESHFAFFVGLGEVLPRLAFESCELEELGSGLWRVRAVLVNESLLPLLSRSARKTRTTRPARVELVLPDAATLVAGRGTTFVSDLPGSGGRSEHVWLVQGPEGMELGVRVDSDHAGSLLQRPEVVR